MTPRVTLRRGEDVAIASRQRDAPGALGHQVGRATLRRGDTSAHSAVRRRRRGSRARLRGGGVGGGCTMVGTLTVLNSPVELIELKLTLLP